jgi:2,3-dihydroxybenzoate-AMP ligase
MTSAGAEGFVPWPDDDAARYVARGYWEGQSLDHRVWSVAARRPDAPAVVHGSARLTYRELTGRADAAAGRLAGIGLEAGDRLLVQLPNCWEFVVLVLACFRARVVPVLTLPALRIREMTAIAEQADARAIAVPGVHRGYDHERMAHEVARSVRGVRRVLAVGPADDRRTTDLSALCDASPDDAPAAARSSRTDPRAIALMLLSGGTTGLPKLIARTHDDYGYLVRRSAEVSGFDERTVYLAVLPVAHNFAFGTPGVLGTLVSGGCAALSATPAAETALSLLERERATHTSLVPTILQRWMEHRASSRRHDLSSLRVVQVGGAPLPFHLAAKARDSLSCTLQQVYGMGEGLLCFTGLGDPGAVTCRTQGRPICPDDELLIVDGANRPVGPNQPGVLLTRGPYTIRGYYRAGGHNARAFTEDGWYRTGDIVRLRGDGNLIVEGREKDVIIRGGENVAAGEIEHFASQVDGVRQAAAVALPDERLGESICLVVVPRSGATVDLAAVHGAMDRAGIARFKYPDHVVCVDSIPLTGVGKVDKSALRSMVEEASPWRSSEPDGAGPVRHRRCAPSRCSGTGATT